MAYGVRSPVPDALFLSQFGTEMRLKALVVFVGSFFCSGVRLCGEGREGGRERGREERTLLRRCFGLFFNTLLGLCVFGLGSWFHGLVLATFCILEELFLCFSSSNTKHSATRGYRRICIFCSFEPPPHESDLLFHCKTVCILAKFWNEVWEFSLDFLGPYDCSHTGLERTTEVFVSSPSLKPYLAANQTISTIALVSMLFTAERDRNDTRLFPYSSFRRHLLLLVENELEVFLGLRFLKPYLTEHSHWSVDSDANYLKHTYIVMHRMLLCMW